MQFVNAQDGWAVGGGAAKFLATTNGGATWTAQSSDTTEDLNGVHFVDAADGWAVGDQGTIAHTSDGGATWTAQSSGTSYQLTGVTFTDIQNGWGHRPELTPKTTTAAASSAHLRRNPNALRSADRAVSGC